jgi:flagellar biosynthesis protein FliR
MISEALQALPGQALSAFLVFCRVGTCLMLIPAVGSARTPMQIRLMVSLGASAAVAASLGEFEGMRDAGANPAHLASLIAIEIGKGLFIGFMARFFFASLQFLAEAAANAIGLATPETSAEDGQSETAIASLVTLTASALFVISDQHLEVLRALLQSYDVLTFGSALNRNTEMSNILEVLGDASLVALQVCSPFLLFAITINFAFGILNRLAPQVPVYFVSTPFVVGGGLMLMYFLSDEIFTIFMGQFSGWLTSGRLR